MDVVVSDLVSCLEDYTLPLMQFSEAFAVVQVGNWTHRTNEPFFLNSEYSMPGICTAEISLQTAHTSSCTRLLRVTYCFLKLAILYSMACNKVISS